MINVLCFDFRLGIWVDFGLLLGLFVLGRFVCVCCLTSFDCLAFYCCGGVAFVIYLFGGFEFGVRY